MRGVRGAYAWAGRWGGLRLLRWRLVHWATDTRAWPRPAAAVAVLAGALAGAAVACGLPPAQQAALADRIFAYVAARMAGQGTVAVPAASGWLRAAAPVWVAGMWPGYGVPVVLAALALHGFSLGFGLGVAGAAGGLAGLEAGVAAVLPGNLLALPALWWLGTRAVSLSAGRRADGGGVPAAYLRVGVAVLALVTMSSVGEATVAPLLLRGLAG